MNTDDPSSGHTQKRTDQFEVEHYQRPVSDYFAAVSKAGFNVRGFFEPEITKGLLKAAPRFVEYTDRPISLVFVCEKA